MGDPLRLGTVEGNNQLKEIRYGSDLVKSIHMKKDDSVVTLYIHSEPQDSFYYEAPCFRIDDKDTIEFVSIELPPHIRKVTGHLVGAGCINNSDSDKTPYIGQNKTLTFDVPDNDRSHYIVALLFGPRYENTSQTGWASRGVSGHSNTRLHTKCALVEVNGSQRTTLQETSVYNASYYVRYRESAMFQDLRYAKDLYQLPYSKMAMGLDLINPSQPPGVGVGGQVSENSTSVISGGSGLFLKFWGDEYFPHYIPTIESNSDDDVLRLNDIINYRVIRPSSTTSSLLNDSGNIPNIQRFPMPFNDKNSSPSYIVLDNAWADLKDKV